MDSATKQMLEAVRKRKANLERIEELILEEFGDHNGSAHTQAATPKTGNKRADAKSPTQKTKLHEWLKKNPGATRAEIVAGAGVPEGTASGYLSAEKEMFENREGKWYAT